MPLWTTRGVELLTSRTGLVSNVVPVEHERWYDFDPHMDVHVGDFVGVQAPKTAQENGEAFMVAKVREVQNVARSNGKFLALWYLPTASKGLREGPNTMRARYANCLIRSWVPDRSYKGEDWIEVATVFTSWTQSTSSKIEMVTHQGYSTEKKIVLPKEQHAHFESHLLLLRDIGLFDGHRE